MKTRNFTSFSILALLFLTVIGGCGNENQTALTISAPNGVSAVTSGLESDEANQYEQVTVEIKDSDQFFTPKTGEYKKINLNNEQSSSDDSSVTIGETSITISRGGTYILSGDYNGTLCIDIDEDAKVYLYLNSVNISASDGPAIYEKSADKVILLLPDGQKNLISDSQIYQDTSDDAPTAAVFCQDSLTIVADGSGSLQVVGKNNDAITSKDNLKLMSGNIDITSADDGVVGRDLLAILGGTIKIQAAGDGLKSTNEEATDKGSISIVDCILNIVTSADGIDAKNSVSILGGTIDISAEKKGIKAVNGVMLTGGSLTIDATDDAIHSNGTVGITAGAYELTSGDDAIHADNYVEIGDCVITIPSSYEGIEGKIIRIHGGAITIHSSDDGLNAAGGKDASGIGGQFGGDQFASGNCEINISNCELYIDAYGDGIDSNGSVTMSSGNVTVSGPVNDGNGPLDYDTTFTMTGGTLLVSGSRGMFQTISSDSSVNCVLYFSDTVISAGEQAVLSDGDTIIASFAIDKDSHALMVADSALVEGNEYQLKLGSTSINVTAKTGNNSNVGGINMPGNRQNPSISGNMGGMVTPDRRKNSDTGTQMTPPNGALPDGTIPEGMPPEGTSPGGMPPTGENDKKWN